MPGRNSIFRPIILLEIILAAGIFLLPAAAQSPESPPIGRPAPSNTRWRQQVNRPPKAQRNYYGVMWGVDSFSVKYAESGEIIRFSYRVLDANKAKALHDKKVDPFLIAPRAGVKLVIPTMEKIGQLRQTVTPELGKSYWMAFSNKGRLVKRGDQVSVTIGNFKVDGLIVQ